MAVFQLVFRVLVSAGAGVGLWAAFPDLSVWPLAFVSVAVMLWVADGVRAWSAFVCGSVFGCAFWFPHLSWTVISTGGAFLPWAALSLIQAFACGVWAFSVSLLTRLRVASRPVGYAGVVAVAWVGVEQLRSLVPFSGFPWAQLAYAHVDAPVGHLAPVGGAPLVGFVVVCVAGLLRVAFASSERFDLVFRRWWSRPLCAGVAALLFVVPVFFPFAASQESGAVRVGAVQGGVEVPGAQTYAIEGKVTANHARETVSLVRGGADVDFIVWGEGALDRDPRRSVLVGETVAAVVQSAGVPVLVGFNEYVAAGAGSGVVHNLYVPWYPAEGLASVSYGKQIPVPFGEYIPFRDFVSSLATEAAQVAVDMEGVDNVGRLDVRLNDGRVLPVGVGICFEVAYEGLWVDSVRSGGEILVSPSNNYHFRDSAEPAQQAQMARFRAMEFGRSMVLVSTTGESMLIRPDGGVLAQTERHSSGVLVGELPLRRSFTPAVFVAVPLGFSVLVLWGVLSVYAWGRAVVVWWRHKHAK